MGLCSMGTIAFVSIFTIILMCRNASAQYDIIGLQQLANNIWGSESDISSNGPMDALDAMLVLLNSRKLHRRNIPNTCPYCPTGYPCSPGCPTVPSPWGSSPGLPGPPGAPGFPVYYPGISGCPGMPGPLGVCIKGIKGARGIDGRTGVCPSVPVPAPVIDMALLRQLLLQYLNCNAAARCRYNIDDLLLRLHRLESKFRLMEQFKQQQAVAEQTMVRLREAYLAKRVRGPRGFIGVPGIQGLKGFPGYEGVEGECKEDLSNRPVLQRGSRGVPGPKGEPGLTGNKVCNCNGVVGDRGVNGLGAVGPQGLKGYKGLKGVPGLHDA